MNSQNTFSVTEARSKIFDLVKKTAVGARFFLTERGRAKAVLMSADEFDSWQETLEIMSDPELMKDIKEAKKDIESGAYKNYPTLEEILAKQGFVLADKSKKKYAVSSRIKKSSAKKSGKNRSKI
ncbi:MAG: type II toxin-antitoxin system prevent-host-death family antitoxin [Candidatus Jacksonbacteria bacterium]